MSYDSIETSLAEGRPLRLYRFARGDVFWYYASGDQPIVHLNRTYVAVTGGIIDDGIRQTGEDSPDDLTITAPADLGVAQLYRVAPPVDGVALTIFARHLDDNDTLACWSGAVSSVRWPALDRCEMVCSPLSNRMSMTGLRLTWGRGCPHALYSSACGVEADAWRVDGIVSALDGASIQVAAAAGRSNGAYTGGFVEWERDGVMERRSILAHSGPQLALFGGTGGFTVGAAVGLYPGCQQTTTACKIFGNLVNFGGIPHMPGVSPFDGRNIF